METPELVAVQTSQGTWVRRADGANDPMRHVNVAQVYAPPHSEARGDSLAERIKSSEAATLQTATLLASAPELADMLRKLVEAHWAEANPSMYSRGAIREAEALLAKVGG
jgi:hypothetical protein